MRNGKIHYLLLLILATVILFNCTIVVEAASNPSRSEIYKTMVTIGHEYNIPPEILYAVGYTESKLRQYNSSGRTLISPDGGIGIMQVTPGHVSVNYDLYQLKYNWKYNIRIGAQVLKTKWNLKNKITTNNGRTGNWIPIIGQGNPLILENWYFALWAYNGFVGENNPNELPKWIGYVGNGYLKEDGYQCKVFDALNNLGFAATELPSSWLPNSGVPTVGSYYDVPQPIHYSAIADQNYVDNKPQGNLVLKDIQIAGLDSFPSVKLMARITNQSETAIKKPFQVTLYNNGKIFKQEVSALAAGATKQISYDPQINDAGEYNYSLLLDSSNQVEEGSEADNKIKGAVKITNDQAKKAEANIAESSGGEFDRNLKIEGLRVLGREYSTQKYKFAAEIVNTGNTPIDNKTYVTLYINQDYYQVPVTDIESWEKKTVIFSTDISYPDTYYYSVLADSKAIVRESSELDNKLNGVVNLKGVTDISNEKVDLTVTYPDQISIGKQAGFRGQVSDKADKIIASVDGYKIADQIVNSNGNFKFDHIFTQSNWNRRLVIKSFTSTGKEVNELETRIRVLKNEQLTVNYPNPIVAGKYIEIKGQALHPIHKVIVSMDGYVLKEEVVKDGIYKINCKINQPGAARQLVVKAFDEQGRAIKELKYKPAVIDRELTVNHPERVKVGQKFKINGKALEPTDKIIVSVDGYVIAEKAVSGQQYNFTTQLNQSGDDRKLVVKGFTGSGTAVAEIKDKIDVVNDDLIKDVPYFYQYYNSYHPSATCQNTSVAMVLGYYGWTGNPDDITRTWGRKKAQSPSGLAELFNHYAQENNLGVRMRAHYDLNISHMRSLLKSGKPVILHNEFTSYGHLVTLVGFDGDYYYVNDPAGRWNQRYKGGYPGRTSTNGKYVKYHKNNLERASLWYHEICFVN